MIINFCLSLIHLFSLIPLFFSNPAICSSPAIFAGCSPENGMCGIVLYIFLFISVPFGPTHPAPASERCHVYCRLGGYKSCKLFSLLEIEHRAVAADGGNESPSRIVDISCSHRNSLTGSFPTVIMYVH